MSDLATIAQLAKTSPQLPVHWYFDPNIERLERQLLFQHGPGYIGHELMVPEPGDYFTLEWMKHAKMLVRNQNGVQLLSNICRHRQAIMKEGQGNATNIVCPLHRWTYGMDGKLVGAPHFPGNPCLDLGSTPLTNWNGLLFRGPRDPNVDLAGLGPLADFSFEGYRLSRVTQVNYNFNWKTFIEVYLEDYHVAPFHPGLGNFVDCDDLQWEFGDWYSVQTVGLNRGLRQPGSNVYSKWHEQVLRVSAGRQPNKGAIWMVYYPNIMLEWYPHVLVISSVWPTGPDKCVNVVEFYYPEELALFEPEFVEAEQQAYEETAVEDQVICERMTAGRRALWESGTSEEGPYQSPMEDGMVHFHEYLRRELGQPATG